MMFESTHRRSLEQMPLDTENRMVGAVAGGRGMGTECLMGTVSVFLQIEAIRMHCSSIPA